MALGNTTVFRNDFDPLNAESKYDNTVYFRTSEIRPTKAQRAEANSGSLKDLLEFNFDAND